MDLTNRAVRDLQPSPTPQVPKPIVSFLSYLAFSIPFPFHGSQDKWSLYSLPELFHPSSLFSEIHFNSLI
jgi:hypothetical protein